jgi:flagellar biosynthetic protein FliP
VRRLAIGAAAAAAILVWASLTFAQDVLVPKISFETAAGKSPTEVATAIQILVVLTVLSVAPAILLTVTSFTRVVIVLSLLRQAVGVPQLPPNQVVVGLSLFLTLFIMAPVGQDIHANAIEPYMAKKIDTNQALERAIAPLRGFMFRQTREADLALMVNLSRIAPPKKQADLPTHVLVPAFAVSEIKTAFQIGFVLFIPFLIIDIVVASVLMSMGMMMLPPVIISLPFKLLLFVLADGWQLVIRALVMGFK